MKITNPTDVREVTAQLEALPQVLETLPLDAGACQILIISTGGYSFYTPTEGVCEVTLQGAKYLARNFWHTDSFNKLLAKHKGIK